MKYFVAMQMFSNFMIFIFTCKFCSVYTSDECGPPPTVFNAEPDLQDLNPPFHNGTILSYSCQNGYILRTNESANIICILDNGTAYWHHNSFACEPGCNDLPIIPHGSVVLNGQSLPILPNDSVNYECSIGYYPIQGKTVATCTIQGGIPSWILPNEPCLPVSCNFPGDIENSHRIGSSFTFGKNVTYICNEGYKRIGSATIFCMSTGKWRPNVPSCEAIICPLLADLENGKIINSDFKYNAVALYECHGNYRLKGSSQRICQADGTWSDSAPTCEEIFCIHPGILDNGRVIPNRTTHRAGDFVIFKCDDGETRTSKCLGTGEWTIRPPICSGVSEVSQDKTKTSTTPLYTKPTAEVNTEKLANSCDDPGDIKNGKKVITGITPNSTAIYSCEEGYELRGKGTLVCMDSGKWNLDKLPICVKPISTLAIVLIVLGLSVILASVVGGYFWYRWRERKVRGYGEKSKALTADATDMEEITGFGKRPIPVTVL